MDNTEMNPRMVLFEGGWGALVHVRFRWLLVAVACQTFSCLFLLLFSDWMIFGSVLYC